MEKVIDARGIACPQPVMMTKDALKETKEGTVKILVDNEVAAQNVSKFGKHAGYDPIFSKKSDHEFEIIFRAGEGAAVSAAEAGETECGTDDRRKGLVVALASDRMGDGSEELGHILMKGFVFALTKQDELPETVLLYNGGAKLSAEGSESLEDLKNLEGQGVEILTCGTCLNFYGLTEKLAVGSVSNMYEIVEKMEQAGSVIRP